VPFDPKAEASAAIVKRLREEEVGWLVTIAGDAPRPVPVWFLWDGDRSALIYSEPVALKVKSSAKNPRAALHFNSDEHGDAIAILYGSVERVSDAPPLIDNAPYMKKYDAAMKRLTAAMQSTAEAVSAAYNLALRFTIEDARSW
jgi:PPOX class probable F420-dependent enzyme